MENRDLAAWGRRAAEWSVAYLESLRDRPVRPKTRPGEVMASLPRRLNRSLSISNRLSCHMSPIGSIRGSSPISRQTTARHQSLPNG